MAKDSKKKESVPEVIPRNGTNPGRARRAQGSPWALPLSRQQGLVLLQTLVIVTAGLWIYWPALHGDWLWDDLIYLPKNPLLHDPARLWKIWFAPGSFIEYYPIEATVQWIQWQLWQDETMGYHVTNVVLHIIGALLVWRLLCKFGLRLAWLGGLIFAVHPAQVESVAWISELKNTLSLPPFLLAMCAWIDYEKEVKRKDYFLALGLFLVAMLCKISMALFPFVILLYAWWKRDRIGWSDLKAGAPFFAISLVLGTITVLAGDWFRRLHPAASDLAAIGGFFPRLDLVGLTTSFYFSKAVLPAGLSLLYPQWVVDPPSLWQFLPWPVLGGVLYWLWSRRQSWGRHALLGLGFFFINLAPFLGFTAASYMNGTWVMIHFLYLPLIGIIGLAVAGLGHLDEQLPSAIRPCLAAVMAMAVAFMSLESHGYAKSYLSEQALWTYMLRHHLESGQAHIYIGNLYMQQGRTAKAIEQYEQAISIAPRESDAYYNLGNALLQAGRISEATEQYRKVLGINPHYAKAHDNLGSILLKTGQLAEAMEEYRQAVNIDPLFAEAYYNLGNVLVREGRLPEAMEQFRKTLSINPRFTQAYYNLGDALLQTDQVEEAIEQYQHALQIDPHNAEAHNNLGVALARVGRNSEAIEQVEMALKLNPNYDDARNNLEKLQALEKTAPTQK